VDRVFRALADATRRDIVRRTLAGGANVTELAADYAMSFAAVQKHIAVLEGAGLVTKQRRGRERVVRGDVEALRRVHGLLDDLELVWQGRIDRLDALLATDPSTSDPTTLAPTATPLDATDLTTTDLTTTDPTTT
jgi:DNA-binding transcriptional ArsR family regulator